MKKLLLLGAMVMVVGVAQATLYSSTYTSGFNNGGVIPDGNAGGWSDTRLISGIPLLPDAEHTDIIRDVNVRLEISGGYNGDLYGYLVHSSGFAVLLNRSGRTSSDAFGYADTGFNVTLDGQASGYDVDIHAYNSSSPTAGFNMSGQLTGTWLEDGRGVDPATVQGTVGERTGGNEALLSSFNTLSANGTWTLFLADMSAGDQSTLMSWGLDIEVVPEPIDWALGIFGGVLGLTALVRGSRNLRAA